MKKYIPCLLLLLLTAGCGRFGKKESNTPKDIRIVCISKHLTEMMFALGKGQDLVAVDLTSSYPDSARLLPTVGYHRALNPEGIVSMKPDLVIHSNDIGPANVIPQLDKLGLNMKTFGAANTYDSAEVVIRQLGDYFGATKKADSIVAKMEADKEMLRDLSK
jgi:iron complex transport system substrate-binding protein